MKGEVLARDGAVERLLTEGRVAVALLLLKNNSWQGIVIDKILSSVGSVSSVFSTYITLLRSSGTRRVLMSGS